MLSANLIFTISLAYVALLFVVAFLGDRQARTGKVSWIQSPIVYTLSISVYCTSWTFYGAVGSAARSGLEFATIYLGPTLVFVGWWFLLRKLVRIGHVHRITSIADLISSRYGKSTSLAVLVTLIAVIGTTPYIALQLKAVTTSIQVIVASDSGNLTGLPENDPASEIAFWIAAGMALFTIIFGTRTIDANERHHGVVAAIALEALVKLFALVAVGLFVVFALADGPADIFSRDAAKILQSEDMFDARWIALTFLSGVAIVCLPRQFQVTVVENTGEEQLRMASWLFPLYLMLMSLFVLPIAIGGLSMLPDGSNPDMFVLTVPMAVDQDLLVMLAFLGGFSSATSMVIVASIALSTMISNHIVMPVMLRTPWTSIERSGDVRRLLLISRRISIGVILLLGYVYFRLSGKSDALAAIGLIAFVGVAQFLPPLLGGIYWKRATASGAKIGLTAGFLLWSYTLFLPSFEGDLLLSANTIEHGPWGVELLRPQALFGLVGQDPLVHALFWSLSANVALFILGSLVFEPKPLERLQGTLFVDVFRTPAGDEHRFIRRSASAEDLFILAQRILGAEEALRLFREFAAGQGLDGDFPQPTDAFIAHLERRLAGSIGAASARAMISQIAAGETISLDELMKIADETAQLMEYSQEVEKKSVQLEATARELRRANQRLTLLDAQKDDFLSQVSHEVRTPMTSIRSFSEILLETRDLASPQAQRFLSIIHEESLRLTRLLDEILDMNLMDRGEASWNLHELDASVPLSRAVETCRGLGSSAGAEIHFEDPDSGIVMADPDRLQQVVINILTNAIKHNTSGKPEVRIGGRLSGSNYEIDVSDNGPGIPLTVRPFIFEKFQRGAAQSSSGGIGLGLAISKEIMARLGGTLTLVDNDGPGTLFRISIPTRIAIPTNAGENI
ncbi:sensor histidine kinase [Nisaea acidiphila]|uniref:histidine kinase n=1 Tax=Nisaea acidiphila TaxID=1862145 RepID=A0A9J7AYW4_9PROT|nr:sensor histidine kinase [Nisaea acidiphila]UUX51625.1 sensor histidine kinase [Nisaea acidiphila]